MDTFDFEKYDVIGFVQKPGLNKGHSTITVMGIVDRISNIYIPLSNSERLALFPTKGCVFAYGMYTKHPDWTGECVRIEVKPNHSTKVLKDRDDFIWNWSSIESIFAEKAVKLKDLLRQNGEENHNMLQAAGVLGADETKYVISGENLYEIKPTIRVASYWHRSDVSDNILECNGHYFVYKDIEKTESGRIDLTYDSQLIDWYKKKILKKEWSIIYESKSFEAVDDIVKDTLQKPNIPSNIYESRLSRITSMSHNIDLTFEELEDLGTSQWFKDAVQEAMDKSIERYIERLNDSRKDIIDKLRKEHSEEERKLEEEHFLKMESEKERFNKEKQQLEDSLSLKKNTIVDLDNTISKKTAENNAILKKAEENITSIEAEIKSKKNELERIESRKDSLVEDFGVIHDVLKMCSISDTKKQTKPTIETIDVGDTDAYPALQPFRKNIESYLISSKAVMVSLDELITRLAKNNVILLPDVKTLNALMNATGKCKYVVEYVGVDWKSFKDLWGNGLASLVDSCYQNNTVIHFLVLRNINMSFVPTYLQPIFDMENGLLTFFPETHTKFPENLKILCTRASESVVPLTQNVLENFGCVAPIEKEVNHTDENIRLIPGYMTSSMMGNLSPYSEMTYNSTESYIDD